MQSNESYVLFTDSASDLPVRMLDELNVKSVPLNVFMKDNPAHPCALRGAAFYQALRGGKVACTSAANLSVFREMFEDVLEQGKDILYLSFSSALSCMYQSGRIAAGELAAEYPGRRIIVIDTLSACLGEGLLVYQAAKRKADGLSLDELAAYVMENRLKTLHWFTVDDLMFLRRGGRLGAVSAVAGSLLGIKPVLNVSNEGKLVPVSKVRGRRKSILALAERYQEECSDKHAAVFIAHADAAEDAALLKQTLLKEYGAKDVFIGEIGPVIGAHAGPGTVALFYLGQSRV